VTPRPTNAYDACLQAADMIEQHHAAYYQGGFCAYTAQDGDATHVFGASSYLDRLKLQQMLTPDINPCGTAWCRCGWMALIVLGQPDERGILTLKHDDVLNWTRMTIWLFYPAADQEYSFDYIQAVNDLIDGNAVYGHGDVGTPEYAAAGADGLRVFAEKWKSVLTSITYPRRYDAPVRDYAY